MCLSGSAGGLGGLGGGGIMSDRPEVHLQRDPLHLNFIGGRHGSMGLTSTGTSTSAGGLGGLGGIGRHTHNGSNHLPVQFFFAPVGHSLPVQFGLKSTCSTSLSSLT